MFSYPQVLYKENNTFQSFQRTTGFNKKRDGFFRPFVNGKYPRTLIILLLLSLVEAQHDFLHLLLLCPFSLKHNQCFPVLELHHSISFPAVVSFMPSFSNDEFKLSYLFPFNKFRCEFCRDWNIEGRHLKDKTAMRFLYLYLTHQVCPSLSRAPLISKRFMRCSEQCTRLNE